MTDKKYIGNFGEKLALRYLIDNKFKVLFRNKREKFDEIDIIARSFDGILIFFEVKTMKIDELDIFRLSPENNMTKQKFYRIKRGCLMFVAKHPELVKNKFGWRIDLIAVTINSEKIYKISHYENISL